MNQQTTTEDALRVEGEVFYGENTHRWYYKVTLVNPPAGMVATERSSQAAGFATADQAEQYARTNGQQLLRRALAYGAVPAPRRFTLEAA